MNQITEIARQADSLFGLKSALEKFGFSAKENLFISFEYEDKVVQTDAIPPVSQAKTSTLDTQDIRATVIDWLNKTEIEYQLSKVYGQQLGLPDQGDSTLTIKFISESQEFVLNQIKLCCPCFPGASFCCYK